MKLRLHGDALAKFPQEMAQEFNIMESELHNRGWTEIDTSSFGIRRLKKLLVVFEGLIQYHKMGRNVQLLKNWIEIIETGSKTKMRTLQSLEIALQNYLAFKGGHRIYELVSTESDAYVAYMVTRVEYRPERRDDRDNYHPARVDVDMIYEKLGENYETEITFYAKEVIRKSVPEILLRRGFVKETSELRAKYIENYNYYQDVIKKIGKQFVATGSGIDDAPSDSGEDSYRYGSADIMLFGNDDKVVIDVFRDSEKDWQPSHVDTAEFWWAKIEKRTGVHYKRDDLKPYERCWECDKTKSQCKCTEDIFDTPMDNDDYESVNEIPIHPYIVVFDLQRHLRLTTHVENLTEYKFDKQLHEKLVLPENIKALVRMLIKHKEGNFVDIIKGKSGGAILLLTGQAGVGKTLTAEVFSEASEKPLYNIQASQLGIDPETIERKLRMFIKRASRWDAIMLIDEADVYVHERGNDLNQNAIVGVFLRVLEYHTATMFLTTNRPDLVDDAVASRCVARIDYKPPTIDNQKKIWKILSKVANISISDQVINSFVDENHIFSGRDIKNILKLANLQSIATQEPITAKTIKYISQFNPTIVKKELSEKKIEVENY